MQKGTPNPSTKFSSLLSRLSFFEFYTGPARLFSLLNIAARGVHYVAAFAGGIFILWNTMNPDRLTFPIRAFDLLIPLSNNLNSIKQQEVEQKLQ